MTGAFNLIFTAILDAAVDVAAGNVTAAVWHVIHQTSFCLFF